MIQYLPHAGVWVLLAVLLVIEPWLARRNVLFGVVFGSADVWQEEGARRLRGRYLWLSGVGNAALTVALALYVALARPGVGAMTAAFLFGTLALLLYGGVCFVVGHSWAVAFKAARGPDADLVQDRMSVDTSVSDRQAILSPLWALVLVPVLAATWILAVTGYSRMPALIPIHYSFTAADAFAPKSWGTVLLPLLSDTVLSAVFVLCGLFMRRAPSSVRGNPQAAPGAIRFRKLMIVIVLFMGVLAQLSFLLMVLANLVAIPPYCFMLTGLLTVLMVAVLLVVYFRFVRSRRPRGPILDDDAKWVLGVFYFNRSDPSTFVEKRSGIGYTLNFARPGGWLFLLGLIVFIIILAFIRKGV